MFIIKIFIFCILFISLIEIPGQCESIPASEDPSTVLSYGDLFLVQQTKPNHHSLDLSLQYNSGMSSPHFNLSGITLGSDFWLKENLFTGLSFGTYSATPSMLQTVLTESLHVSKISVAYLSPKNSLYGRIGYSPLQGLANIFGSSVAATDLILGVGLGTTQYSNSVFQPGVQAFLEERVLFYKSLGACLGYTQYWERMDSNPNPAETYWLSRGQFHLGAYVRL